MTDIQKKQLINAISYIIYSMVNEDGTALVTSNKVATIDSDGDITWENESEATGEVIADSEAVFYYLDGGGRDSILYAINNPDECAEDMINCYYRDYSELIEELGH